VLVGFLEVAPWTSRELGIKVLKAKGTSRETIISNGFQRHCFKAEPVFLMS
jgi:hypothetical protein